MSEPTSKDYRRLKIILNEARTAFGPLTPDAKRKITALVKRPSGDTWEAAHGYVIAPRPGFGRTIWQAMLAISTDFPNHGPYTHETDQTAAWLKLLPPEWRREDGSSQFARSKLLQAMEEALHDYNTIVIEQGYEDQPQKEPDNE